MTAPEVTPTTRDRDAIEILEGFCEYIRDVGSTDRELRRAIRIALAWLRDQKAAL